MRLWIKQKGGGWGVPVLSFLLLGFLSVLNGAGKKEFSLLYERLVPSLVSVESPSVVGDEKRFLGTGVIVSKSGYILTSGSAIKGLQRLTVVNRAEKRYLPADVVGRDGGSDLALLRIESKEPLKPVVFNQTDQPAAGTIALILAERQQEKIRSALVVSGGKELLRLDRPAISGGALITDRDGNPIGVASKKMSSVATLVSPDAKEIVSVMNRLMEEDRVLRAYFGMTAENLSPELYGYYGIRRGVLVTGIETNASAEQAGLMRGDLIVGVGDKSIRDKGSLVSIVSQYKNDDNVTIHYVRNTLNKSLQMRLSRINQELLNPKAFWYKGMVLENISSEWAGIYRIPGYLKGVVVTLVEPGSPAEAGGIRQGDVIFQLDSKTIKELEDFRQYADKSRKERLFIFRDGWNFIKLLAEKEEKKK